MKNLADKLVVDIALLSLVTDHPEDPSDIGPCRVNESGRIISLKDERSISHQLAFICAHSDSPDHVMAACVEEENSHNGLIIRFSANKGEHDNVLAALNDMAPIVQHEATKDVHAFVLKKVMSLLTLNVVNRLKNEESLLRIIVKLHCTRILSRLCSCHANRLLKVNGKTLHSAQD